MRNYASGASPPKAAGGAVAKRAAGGKAPLLVLVGMAVACGGRVERTRNHDTFQVRAACESDGGVGPMEPRFCSVPPPNQFPTTPASTDSNSVSGRVLGLEMDRLGQACNGLAGVRACVHPSPPDACIPTGPDGTFVFAVPPIWTGEQEIDFIDEHDEYEPAIRQVVLGEPVAMGDVPLWSRRYWEMTRACVGATGSQKLGDGLLSVTALTAGTPALAFQATPASGIGPIYQYDATDPARLYGVDPKAHTTQGVSQSALWFDVTPGDYELHIFTETGVDLADHCIPRSWGKAADGSQRFRINAGAITHAGAFCVPVLR